MPAVLVLALALPGCSRPGLVKPDASQVRSITIDAKEFLGRFDVRSDDFASVLEILDDPVPDPEPAKWESVGAMVIHMKSGGSLEIRLYQTGGGKGAYSWQRSQRTRVYYRGSSDDQIFRALSQAFEKTRRTEKVTPPSVVDGGEFWQREMYWCSRSLLLQDWYLVLACELVDVHRVAMPDLAKKEFTEGIFKIHEVILSRPTDGEVFRSADTLRAQGCEGLVPGDKVLVFMSRYERSYGLIPAEGSNCRIGIKIPSFDASIVAAVRKWGAHAGPELEKYGLLLDDDYAATWRRYGHMGINEVLKRHTFLLEKAKEQQRAPRSSFAP